MSYADQTCPDGHGRMQYHGETRHDHIHWCPVCGLLRRVMTDIGDVRDSVPRLVDHVRGALAGEVPAQISVREAVTT